MCQKKRVSAQILKPVPALPYRLTHTWETRGWREKTAVNKFVFFSLLNPTLVSVLLGCIYLHLKGFLKCRSTDSISVSSYKCRGMKATQSSCFAQDINFSTFYNFKKKIKYFKTAEFLKKKKIVKVIQNKVMACIMNQGQEF